MKTGNFILSGVLSVVLMQMAFAQWTPVQGPTQEVRYLSANGTDMFAQTNTGFFYSTDNGAHWAQANSGIGDSLLSAFPADSVDLLLSNVNYQIPPLPGSLNQSASQIDYSSLATLVTSLSILFPGTTIDSIYVSLDTGSTAIRLSQIMASLALYAAGVDTTDILSKVRIAEASFSTDGGTEWVSFQEVISSVSIRATESTENYVFVGTNRGVYRAPKQNTGWEQVNSGLVDTNVRALTSIGGAWLFAGTDGGVFLSSNNGTTWNSVNTGLTNKKVLSLAAAGYSLFAATNGGGVFVSVNRGSSWKAVNQGLSSLVVNALAIGDNALFAGTSGGLWERPVAQMITGMNESKNAVLESFTLFQNYPNPFNPSTVINYVLPATGFTTLRVYDLLGREIQSLVDTRQSAGYHSVTFDGSGLASGTYFYRLQAGAYHDTKKFFFLK